MKFFSNETAKDNADEHDEAGRVRTEPGEHPGADPEAAAAVPQQRAGSPWSDAPGGADADAELADRERRDGTEDRSEDRTEDHTEDRSEDRGLTGNGGRPVDNDGDRDNDGVADRVEDPAARDAGTRDTEADDPDTTTYGPDGSVTTNREDADGSADHDAPFDQDAVKDEGTFDSPTAVEPTTGAALDAEKTHDADKADDTDRVDGAAAATVPTEAAPVVAVAVPTATAASTTNDDGGRFFPATEDYAEKFRDIQLRFVDSPKEATGEASALVGEALEKLTTALRERKEALDDDSEDTEKLRVALRGYRDLLNRLLAI